jgi:thymidylate synthase
MNNLDKTYTALLQDILDNGTKKETRNGGTLSVFGRQIRHKMSEGFPLLTTKKMAWKTIVTELLWFLRGDTNIKYLVDNNCHIWDGDAYKAFCKERLEIHNKIVKENPTCDFQPWEEEITKEEFINRIKTDADFAEKWGELGPIYGKQWRDWGSSLSTEFERSEYTTIDGTFSYPVSKRKYVKGIDQISNLINDLKTNPDSRRLMVNAWNVGELDQMVLPPCHYGFQVYTRELSLAERVKLFSESVNGEHLMKYADSDGLDMWNVILSKHNIPTRAISLMWNQRSVDTFLGLPFNIASYGLLLEIIAKEVNMVPDELIGNLGDVHLYSNHIEQAKEQIGRDLTVEERGSLYRKQQNLSNDVELVGSDRDAYRVFDDYGITKRTREPFPLPKLFFKYGKETYIDNYELDGFILKDYQSHPTIKAPLSN